MIRRLLPILGITFVDILGFSMLIPMLPYFVTHFGASAVVVGGVFAVFSLCQFIAGPIWGNASDRIGRKGVLIISQIGATIGWTMQAFAPNIAIVFLARIVEGTSGGNIGVTQAYVADLVEPKQRARAFGLIGASFGAGFVFGPAATSLLFAHYGYRVTFLVAALLQLLTLVLTVAFLRESRSKADEARSRVGLREIAGTFADPKLSRILWQKLAVSLGLYAWFSVMALFMMRQLHFHLFETGFYFSVISVLTVFVNGYVVGRASERLGNRLMSTIGIGLLCAGFLLVPFIHGIPTLLALSILFAFGMGFANTGISTLVSTNASDAQQGTALGVSSSLDSLSGIVSPPVSTEILGRFGSPYAGAASAFFALIALALGLAASRRERAQAILATATTLTAQSAEAET